MDDFEVKYVGMEHADHLMAALKEDYAISHNWEGNRYLGLTFDWDYDKRIVMVSMPEYFENAPQHFHHVRPKKTQDQLHPHVVPKYGANKQYVEGTDTSSIPDKKGKKFVQEVVGTFLYYARGCQLHNACSP